MSSTDDTPRGTRLTRAQRRRQLLDAALVVFVDGGYHATGMDEIADRAGVSKPVLYQHFPGKMDLYLALLDEAADSLIDSVLGAMDGVCDNHERVAAAVLAYFRFVAADKSPYRLVFESDLSHDEEVEARATRVTTTTAAAIARVLHAETGMNQASTSLLATSVVGMAQISARAWLADQSALTLEQAAGLVTTLAWGGVGGFPLALTEEARREEAGNDRAGTPR